MFKTSSSKYFILFTISLLLYFLHAVITLQGLYGDGNGYYSYTNSLFFQRNLDFSPIYAHLENFVGPKYIFSRMFWNPESNPYLIGTSLVWLPSMSFISGISNLFALDLNRFDLVYELGPGITGILLMIFGLVFLEKYLQNFFGKLTVNMTILILFFASNVFYYTALEPALSHQPSFFIICFLLFWTYKFRVSTLNVFVLGLLSGFLASIRIADIVLLIPIFYQAGLKIKNMLIAFFGALIAFTPQFINQLNMYQNIATHPYLTGESGTWKLSGIQFLEYLFSPKRGLFLWTPLFGVGLWGLIKSKSLVFIFSIVILWIITSSWSAYLSAGFGQRLSFSTIPFFAYGIAYILEKKDLKKIVFIGTLFATWNFLLLKNIYLHKDIFIQSPDFGIKIFLTYMLKIN